MGQTLSIRSIQGQVIATTNATPYQAYTVQASTNPAGPFQSIGQVYADGNGSFDYTNFPGKDRYFYRTETSSGSNQTVEVSLDGSSPLQNTVGVINTTQGQYLHLPVTVFDLSAGNQDIHLHNVTVNVNASGSGAVTDAYLYQGSTPIASATVTNGLAIFAGIADYDGTTVSANTTIPFTVKVDVVGLTGPNASETVSVSVSAAGITAFDGSGNEASVGGIANGNTTTVVGAGAWFTLASSPTITSQNISPGGATDITIVYKATFNVNVIAVGESVTFGLPSSSNPAFGGSNAGTNHVQLYENILAAQNNGGLQIIASYSQPGNTTLSSDGTSFMVAQNQTVTIPITYQFVVTNPGANTFSFGMTGINWSANGQQQTTTVTSNSWKTSNL